MSREIDFTRLKLQDALDLAILIEDEAEERYLEFAVQMEEFQTPEAGTFFRFMSANEKKHGQELRLRRTARFGAAPAAVDRGMLFDVEAPAYEKARAFMSPRQALTVALESEIKAHDYFAAALPHLKDSEVKALFEELRLEEVEHQELVKRELAKQPPDDGLDPEAFVDEPPAL
jgi:erythrin-vacuolar iron transport family protein